MNPYTISFMYIYIYNFSFKAWKFVFDNVNIVWQNKYLIKENLNERKKSVTVRQQFTTEQTLVKRCGWKLREMLVSYQMFG